MKKTHLLLAILLCAAWLLPSPSQARRKAQKKQIPILAWYSIPPGEFSTEERYHELRECGFTHSFAHIYSMPDALKALDGPIGTIRKRRAAQRESEAPAPETPPGETSPG